MISFSLWQNKFMFRPQYWEECVKNNLNVLLKNWLTDWRKRGWLMSNFRWLQTDFFSWNQKIKHHQCIQSKKQLKMHCRRKKLVWVGLPSLIHDLAPNVLFTYNCTYRNVLTSRPSIDSQIIEISSILPINISIYLVCTYSLTLSLTNIG